VYVLKSFLRIGNLRMRGFEGEIAILPYPYVPMTMTEKTPWTMCTGRTKGVRSVIVIYLSGREIEGVEN
jgi:hypothetical protein